MAAARLHGGGRPEAGPDDGARAGAAGVRAALVGLGWAAAAALLWFVGPLVAVAGHVPLAEPGARVAAIAALAAAVAARAGWRAARRTRRNRRLLDGLLGASPADTRAAPPAAALAASSASPATTTPRAPSPGEREVALLGQRFAAAVAQLRSGRVGARRRGWAALGRPWVYELPWYVILGAPGAGKTTALVNSGLEFPLAAKVGDKVVRGIGGTRHCDWWFASEAVLIDTAGRYTTHDSDREADRTAWLGFLDLLAKHRPQRPLNGVLLTLAASELLGASAEQRQAHAAELRARIDELHQRLGLRLPIYVLVTKTDLLAGFMEFFADLDRDERAQVWGTTFAHDAADPLAGAAGDFAALEKRLADRLLERLHDEPDRERRAAIHAFALQWRLLRETLADVLQATFAPAPAPWLRGVYFTSATQEGAPVDRALGGLARALGLASRVVAPARPSGRTYFMTRLLREVVFAEAGLAGTRLHWQRRRRALDLALAGGGVAATLAVAVLALRAFGDERDAVAAVAARLPALEREVERARAAAPTELAAVLPALDALAALVPAGPAPGLGSLGLEQRPALAAAAGDAYRRALREAMLPRLASRLERRLQEGSADQVGLIYEALRAYLMLFDGDHFDRPALRGYLAAEAEATLAPAARQALGRHLDALVAGGEVGAPSLASAALVARARAQVAGVPLAERAWRRLQQLEPGPPFNAEAVAGAALRPLVVRASGRPLDEGVPALYSRDFHRTALRPRTAEVLRQFAAEQSWVLGAAAPAQGVAEPAGVDVVDDVERLYLAEQARRWHAWIADLRLPTPAALGASADLAQALSRPDSPWLTLLRALGDELAPADPRLSAWLAGEAVSRLQSQLGTLAAHLRAVDDAARRRVLAPPSDAVAALSQALADAPEPVRGMLQPLLRETSTQLWAALREPLARSLAAEVAPACARAVDGRYPFGSGPEVSREEFERTFGAGGLLDAFWQRRLAPHAGALRAGAAQPFRDAQALREAFLGARGLEVRLQWRLLELDAAEFRLDVDGQALRFRRDSRGTQTLVWPGPGPGRLTLQVGGAPHVFEGAWSLLRLFERVRVQPREGDRLEVLFDVEGRRARFELTGAAALQPPLRAQMERFRCPTQL